MRFLVDEINKIIFGWNAKAGCSHIKNLFYYLTDTQPFTNIHRQVADKSLPDDYIKYTIIIITRNPYERIVSGFIEKYVSGKIRLPKQFSQDTITFNQFTKDILFQNQKVIDITKVDKLNFLVLTETSLSKVSFLPNGSIGSTEIISNNKSFLNAHFYFSKKNIFIWSANQSSFIQYNKTNE